jgi:transcriptional regulator with XRE-family HTH domain
MNKKHIGQRVKLARIFYEQKTGNKMTQEILANKTGTKRGTIGDIELGRSYPSIEMAYKITQACGVTLDFLVSEELKEIPKELNELGIEYVVKQEIPTCWGFFALCDKKNKPPISRRLEEEGGFIFCNCLLFFYINLVCKDVCRIIPTVIQVHQVLHAPE